MPLFQHPTVDTFDGAKPRFLNQGKKHHSVSTLSIFRASDRRVEWVDLIKNLVAGDPSKIDLTSTDSALKFYQAQGLTPLLYHRLKDQDLNGSVPIEILEQLKKEYYLTAASNLAKLNQTSKVLQAFQEANILAIPLKGIALIESLYPNPAIRPMTDVDLLIKPEDFNRVKGILERAGYRWVSSYRGSHNFIDEEGQWSFDLHTKFIRFEFSIPY